MVVVFYQGLERFPEHQRGTMGIVLLAGMVVLAALLAYWMITAGDPDE